jgi:hypothetical protein
MRVLDCPPAAADYRDRVEAVTGTSLCICPMCHHGHMGEITFDVRPSASTAPRPPP